MQYNIRPDRRRRSSSDPHVIITHMPNLLLKDFSYGNENLIRGSYKYSWGRTQNYLIRHAFRYGLPMHYYVELLDKDYVVFKGISEYKPSYYVNELVDLGIIQRKYRDAILVVIAEDFSLTTPDERMFSHLADKVLVHIKKTMGIPYNKIDYIDECYTDSYLDHLDECRFKFKPMTKFDKSKMQLYFRKYDVM